MRKNLNKTIINLLSFAIPFLSAGCSMTMVYSPAPAVPPRITAGHNLQINKISKIAVLNLKDSGKSEQRYMPVPPWPENTLALAYPYLNDGEHIAKRIESALVKSFKFTVVERAQIDELLKEQKFQYPGAVDADTAVKVGKLIGVDAVFFGEVDVCRLFKLYEFNAFGGVGIDVPDLAFTLKLADVATSEIQYVFQTNVKGNNLLRAPLTVEQSKVKKDVYYYAGVTPSLDKTIDYAVNSMVKDFISR